MNSELIDKAFLKSDLVSCIDYDVLNYKECLNKFAELIVKECSGILRTEANSNWEGREERLLNAMANWIENHFGVEE
jgi:hypothetical protein